jgi:predicted RNA-binding Zn ribbon-like protein
MEANVEPSRAGSVALVGGALALDFTNTAGGRHMPDPIEHLQEPRHVVEWAVHAGALAGATAKRAHAAVARGGAEAQRLLREAVSLRETIYRIGSEIAEGGAAKADDLEVLKRFAQKALGPAALARGADARYRFDFSSAPVDIALLGPVAWSAIELLETGDFERLKRCPGHDCGWLFYDRSKNNSRRWCDMAVCGNREKVKRHRDK